MSKHPQDRRFVKIYHGYGHMHDLLLYGHLFERKPVARKRYSNNIFSNLLYLLRLFFVKTVPLAPVSLEWQNETFHNKTEADGFIKFEWKSQGPVPAGWHAVEVQYQDDKGIVTGKGELFVPHKTQYGFISDIDDTIMISHSSTVFRRMRL
ncbi:MAG TPA: hypothetical protein VL307_16020, partial [Chitinophagaceae bacterium]|nr:hypothetical protein [Chitinophagaceae bacterium]